MKKKKPTVTIQAGDDRLAANELEVKVVMRGTPFAVIAALANGLPREALKAIQSALADQLVARWPVARRRTRKQP